MLAGELAYACSLVAQAVPFALFLGILAVTLRVTWDRWP